MEIKFCNLFSPPLGEDEAIKEDDHNARFKNYFVIERNGAVFYYDNSQEFIDIYDNDIVLELLSKNNSINRTLKPLIRVDCSFDELVQTLCSEHNLYYEYMFIVTKYVTPAHKFHFCTYRLKFIFNEKRFFGGSNVCTIESEHTSLSSIIAKLLQYDGCRPTPPPAETKYFSFFFDIFEITPQTNYYPGYIGKSLINGRSFHINSNDDLVQYIAKIDPDKSVLTISNGFVLNNDRHTSVQEFLGMKRDHTFPTTATDIEHLAADGLTHINGVKIDFCQMYLYETIACIFLSIGLQTNPDISIVSFDVTTEHFTHDYFVLMYNYNNKKFKKIIHAHEIASRRWAYDEFNGFNPTEVVLYRPSIQ